MKVNLKNTTSSRVRQRTYYDHHGESCKNNFESSFIGNNNINMSKPTRDNLRGFVVFKGNGISKANDFASRLVSSEKFNHLTKYVLHNEAMFSATTVLALGTTVKPALSMVMPGANKKDKVSIAAKNIVSAIISYVMASLVMKPVNKAVNKLLADPAKYIKNDPEMVARLSSNLNLDKPFNDAFIAFWKNAPECLVSPIKATLCVAFTPAVIKLLNFGKNKKQKELQSIEKNILNDVKTNPDADLIYSKVINGGKNDTATP